MGSARRPIAFQSIVLLAAGAALSSCRAPRTAEEGAARAELERVGALLRASSADELPALSSGSSPADFARYAVLRNPEVRLRYERWAEAVEEVTLARFPPDPSFTLQPEFQAGLANFFVGWMAGPINVRKLALAAEARSEAARVARIELVAAVATTAARAHVAHLEAGFLGESLRIAREVHALVGELVDLAEAQYRVSRVTRQDVLRLEIERDSLANELLSLEDSASTNRARVRSALGIPPGEAEPPLPERLAETALELPGDDLLALALERSPDLRALEGELREAEALVALARRARSPEVELDLELGLDSPAVFAPEVAFSVPWIFPEKVRATIAAALAERDAAAARLEGGRLELLVLVAELAFQHRDARRRIALYDERLLPRANEALELARAGYVTGSVDVTSLLDAERSLFQFRLARTRALLERESAAARLVFELLARGEASAPFLETERGS